MRVREPCPVRGRTRIRSCPVVLDSRGIAQEVLMSHVKSITEAFELTHDEVNYARFTSILRKRILMDLSQDMKAVYEKRVGPAFEKANGKTPSGREIRRAKTVNRVRCSALSFPMTQSWKRCHSMRPVTHPANQTTNSAMRLRP